MRKFGYLAAGAAALALSVRDAPTPTPKTNMLHQWATGSDAAAIAKLGEMFTAAGGVWEQTAIAGHTANTLAKLRADVVAGNAPPAVQLKGPEIAEWNATGGTANLDELAAAERLGQGRRARASAGDEAGRPLGRGADEHPPHQLALGQQERARTPPASPSCRRPGPSSTPTATRSSRPARSASRTSAPTGPTPPLFEVVVYGQDIDLFSKAFVEGDLDALRSEGMVKAFDADAPDGHEVHGPGDRRPRLRHRLSMMVERRGRLLHHGRLGDRHAHRRRLQAERRLSSAARRRPTGASRASS